MIGNSQPEKAQKREMPWTVTNSFRRGLMMKTYGRSPWRVYDDDQRPAAKKRRVLSDSESDAAEKSLQYAIRESTANVRSSPSRRNSIALSDGSQDDDLSTPPSSPPPPRLTPPPQNTRKPTFSFLKRKHSATDGATNGSPLSEVNSNSVRASLDPPKKKAATSTSQQQPVLKQMQLDLGHEVRKTCATCGMEYIPSNVEDASLHKKFHDMNSTGVDLGKAFMRANASRWVYEATRFDEGYVVIVDRKSSPTAKNQAKKVLEVLSKELSSPVIEDEVLWSQTEPPKHLRKNGATEKVDRYKVFLHMKDSRCVGACLTERIWESHPVDKASAQKDGIDAAVAVGDASHPAIVGISRIWTSGSSRRKGIAMDLLDCVVSNFIYGMEIPKEQVAFSQPTNSGKSLAQAFFGPENEWHVYKES
ncbi:ESCO1/2 acetyl-transferase-domain-containing protein [Aspergillus keveii]|uniref:ESCO1/2 acetyl-transferase-domain-containing protein n=1 Tax=Aspergillus keveii TaxID=714993 RepID=A0ABR4G3Q1_9EURO